jgi:hypothetical protein
LTASTLRDVASGSSTVSAAWAPGAGGVGIGVTGTVRSRTVGSGTGIATWGNASWVRRFDSSARNALPSAGRAAGSRRVARTTSSSSAGGIPATRWLGGGTSSFTCR